MLRSFFKSYFKVFVIAISRIKQAQRLIFGKYLGNKLIKRNIEKQKVFMLRSSFKS